MRWPWQRRAQPDAEEAKAAREEALKKLGAANRRQDQIDEVVSELRELRKRNRFAELIAETMLPARRKDDG